MKKLVILTLLTMSLSALSCEITLSKKKEDAKTSYINGVSVSAKIQDALKTQCKLNTKILSKEEVKQMTIDSLEKRLEKLKSK